jgi:para-nitrobenzyl esterase
VKKTKLLIIIVVIAISAGLLAGCKTFTDTKTVNTAGLESSGQTNGVVKTTAGLVHGTNNDGIYTYPGVPYAEATERFVPAG